MVEYIKYKGYSICSPHPNHGQYYLVYGGQSPEAFQVPFETEQEAANFIDLGEEYMNEESRRWTSGNSSQRFWQRSKAKIFSDILTPEEIKLFEEGQLNEFTFLEYVAVGGGQRPRSRASTFVIDPSVNQDKVVVSVLDMTNKVWMTNIYKNS